MRRFTPPAASPAIDNCGSRETLGTAGLASRLTCGMTGRRYLAWLARVDLRSPVTAFSAARLISDA
jgi:hypothetical protein